ncbi:protein-glutamate O-methyltransferase CheR (plasmid) [Kovacikia minuta CCNUW1]|uniref:CheR family methyltransferase n=1 Tax=Kovacikia minuta TaxID=2931930 RepID=UPI001CC93325|nr:protein-glutamate O-methyltransferase CheR [Kovacikia minuta]UBF30441.1 protein-glutamate O-methyltransferase CheR [Kovacikia minuta CCNUW1]
MLNFPLASSVTPRLEEIQLEDLLHSLKRIFQVDLTGYKRPGLRRRILARMQWVGVAHYQDYLNLLQQQPNEVQHLLDTIYINFTGFFRDRPVWDFLANRVIPQMIANKAPNEPIRVWSVGCATGEETYSLAMLLIEALGIKQFQRQVWIDGTDVDADAILQARQGYYPSHQVEALPKALQAQYFERRNEGYCWRQDLHCSIRFRPHNLIQHPPLPQIDLLVCRNLLMYLTEEAQLQALARLHHSLEENGVLVLGKAEPLVTRRQRSLFTPIHRQSRIFTKGPGSVLKRSNLG